MYQNTASLNNLQVRQSRLNTISYAEKMNWLGTENAIVVLKDIKIAGLSVPLASEYIDYQA